MHEILAARTFQETTTRPAIMITTDTIALCGRAYQRWGETEKKKKKKKKRVDVLATTAQYLVIYIQRLST